MFGKKEFGAVFKVNDIIQSSNPARANAARLKIVAIEDDAIRYQSLTAKRERQPLLNYAHLKVVLDNFDLLKQKSSTDRRTSITDSVNHLFKQAGLKLDHTSETYTYSIAKEFHKRTERTARRLFLSQGETADRTPGSLNGTYYTEGNRISVLVERIERDLKARKACIKYFGPRCRACDFHFEEKYGLRGKGFIHVHHHQSELASTHGDHKVDPKKDLIPLCPNCHAMIHRRKPMLSLDELRRLLKHRKCQ